MPTMPMTLAQRLKREVEQAREAKERAAKDCQVTDLSQRDFDSLKRLDKTPNDALRRAMARANEEPVSEHCAMEAYFEAHKNDPNGGASMAMLVCRCSRCAGRVTA